jgi:hypothetical protein
VRGIECSIAGYPELKPAWFRNSVGPLAFSVFADGVAIVIRSRQGDSGAAALTRPAATQSLQRRRHC